MYPFTGDVVFITFEEVPFDMMILYNPWDTLNDNVTLGAEKARSGYMEWKRAVTHSFGWEI